VVATTVTARALSVVSGMAFRIDGLTPAEAAALLRDIGWFWARVAPCECLRTRHPSICASDDGLYGLVESGSVVIR
jgi:hypothetical protein